MRITRWLFWILIGSVFLSSCITVELKDERTIPKFYQVVMITYTPSGTVKEEPTATPSPTTTLTHTPSATALPSATDAPTATLTPISPTPDPFALVILNAFCRQGPGTGYPATSAVMAGEEVDLLGRNLDATWWRVQDQEGESCWVSASVLELPESLSGISILSVPSTPRPAYTVPPAPTATRRPRRDSPAATETGVVPQATDTPNPYPYPAP